MTIQEAFENFKISYLDTWLKNEVASEEEVNRLQEMVNEGLITEEDFKLSPLVLGALAGMRHGEIGGFHYDSENGLKALREKLITPMQLNELYKLPLAPHHIVGVEIALTDESLEIMRKKGADALMGAIKGADNSSIVATSNVRGLVFEIQRVANKAI